MTASPPPLPAKHRQAGYASIPSSELAMSCGGEPEKSSLESK